MGKSRPKGGKSPKLITSFLKIYNFVFYLFLIVLDLCCCEGFSLVVASRSCFQVTMLRVLIVVV